MSKNASKNRSKWHSSRIYNILKVIDIHALDEFEPDKLDNDDLRQLRSDYVVIGNNIYGQETMNHALAILENWEHVSREAKQTCLLVRDRLNDSLIDGYRR